MGHSCEQARIDHLNTSFIFSFFSFLLLIVSILFFIFITFSSSFFFYFYLCALSLISSFFSTSFFIDSLTPLLICLFLLLSFCHLFSLAHLPPPLLSLFTNFLSLPSSCNFVSQCYSPHFFYTSSQLLFFLLLPPFPLFSSPLFTRP